MSDRSKINWSARSRYLIACGGVDIAIGCAIRVFPQRAVKFDQLGEQIQDALQSWFHDENATHCDCDEHDDAPQASTSAPN